METTKTIQVRQDFNLIGYYTLASLLVMSIVGLTIMAVVCYWVQESFLRTERDIADNLAEEVLVNLKSAGFTFRPHGTTATSKTNLALQHLMENFGILSVELFLPDGTPVFELGERPYAPPEWKAGWEAALRGKTASRWNPSEWVLISVLRDSGSWIESYSPIRESGQTVGVAYLRRDWNTVLLAERRAWTPILYTAMLGGLLTFFALWLIVHRAGRQIRQQQAEIHDANQRLQLMVDRLSEANRSLEQLDMQKDYFLSVCSHDIRSPLIGVVAGCRLLLREKRGPLTEKQREILETSLRSSQNVLELTTSLLDMARLENGVEHLVMETVDLKLMLHQTCESHRWIADAKQVSLRLSLPLHPIQLQGDRIKILRICNNLLSNAIKYSPHATEVRVELALEPDHVTFSVTDQGPGISKENQGLLFDRFSKLARKKSSRDEGTGLGLAITLGLVHLHQGRIKVESELGKGSTFRVSLPTCHPESKPAVSRPDACCPETGKEART